MGRQHALLAACSIIALVHIVAARDVKSADKLFGVPIFGAKRGKGVDKEHSTSDEEELAEWLSSLGYTQYASPEFIAKLDDVLAYDSIEDFASIFEDEEYDEIGIPKEEAQKLEQAAKREMLGRFLAAIPVLEGSEAGMYVKHVDALLDAGFDDPEDVEDLEEGQGEKMGLTKEEVALFIRRASEHETRGVFHSILETAKREPRLWQLLQIFPRLSRA